MRGRSRLAIAATATVPVLALAALTIFLGSRFTGPPIWAGEDDRDSAHRGRGAYLGVRVEEATDLEEGGARVYDVIPDSPAEEAGIEEGDVIVRFRGEPVGGPIALTRKIRAARPGETVELEIVRDGERKKIAVELGERPSWPGMGALKHLERLEDIEKLVVPDIRKEIRKYRIPGGGQAWMFRFGGKPKLGVELVQTTPELREFFGADRDAGVLVGRVMKGSAAEKAGIRVGDLIVAVDGEKVRDASEIVEALEDKDGKRVELVVIRERRTIKLEADIPGEEEEEEEPVGPRAWLLAPRPPAPPPAPRVLTAAPPPPPRALPAPLLPRVIIEGVEIAPLPEEPLEDELTVL